MTFGKFKLVFLTTDILVFLLVLSGIGFLFFARRREYYKTAWRQIRARRLPMVCMGIVLLYTLVALLDSVHFQQRAYAEGGEAQTTADGRPAYRAEILSLLDLFCTGLRGRTEKTFSAPFATRQFTKELIERKDGSRIRDYPPLAYGGSHLQNPDEKARDILGLVLRGMLAGLGIGILLAGLTAGVYAGYVHFGSVAPEGSPSPASALRTGLKAGAFLGAAALIVSVVAVLSAKYHFLGTDQVGRDVLFRAIKGCRVGLIVGTLTTLIATPVAILFGIMAGYFGGRVDDLIQYIYTTLSSIPGILLIAAAMLIVTTKIQQMHTVYASDIRLAWLCAVLGIGSWTGLCRLIRGETLKVRENEYIQASEAFGVGHLKIMFRHILPNVMHIVLISVILRFSGLVLAEAVLAYVGIGVDPSMESWGNMINAARLEISRDPIVWWNLLAAFVFMFGLVLPANIFGDAVRDALDPRLRTE